MSDMTNTAQLVAALRITAARLEAAGERDLPGLVHINLSVGLHHDECTNADLRAAADHLAAAIGWPQPVADAITTGGHHMYQSRSRRGADSPINGYIVAFLKIKQVVELEP